MSRPFINSFSPAQRQDLVTRILAYIDDDVVDAHMQIVHSGEAIFTGHRAYVAGLEQYLQQNGGGAFVPLPKWDPATPIPGEFNIVKAEDDGTLRPALENLNPHLPLPPAFRPPSLCTFPTADALGNAINAWHGSVHLAIGGTMGDAMISPAAPIFWCWHGFVDDVYAEWLACPAHGHQPMAADLLDFDALMNSPKPIGAVSATLHREWADWGKNTLRLKQ